MKSAIVQSVCECETKLFAELDEHHHVARGWVKDRRGYELLAPAIAIGPERERFDVGWACPICTRNCMRSFEAAGLFYRSS